MNLIPDSLYQKDTIVNFWVVHYVYSIQIMPLLLKIYYVLVTVMIGTV